MYRIKIAHHIHVSLRVPVPKLNMIYIQAAVTEQALVLFFSYFS